MFNVIFQGPSFQWKKFRIHIKPHFWDIQFWIFIVVPNFFIFSIEKAIKNAFLPDFELNFTFANFDEIFGMDSFWTL
jgi:hypothetical protein